MKQAEITIISTDDGRHEVKASIPGNMSPASVIEGIRCHVKTVANAYHMDEAQILMFVTMLSHALSQDKDAVHEEMTRIEMPLDLGKGKAD